MHANTSNDTVASSPIADKMLALSGKFSTIAGVFSGYLMVFLSIIMVYEILVRKVFEPTTWVYEVSCYGLVWFGFLSASYGLKAGSHINVDLIITMFKQDVRDALEVVSYILITIYSILLTIYTGEIFIDAVKSKELSATILQAPMSLVYFGLVAGCVILAVQALLMTSVKVMNLRKIKTEKAKGFFNNRTAVAIAYTVLIAICLVLVSINPTIGIIALTITLLLGGVPIFTSLGIVGSYTLYLLLGQTGLIQIGMVAFKSLDNNVLLAIPLFMIAGQLLQSGDIGQELFDLCSKWIGHWPGGAGIATVAACAIFAAISGSSVATAAAIGLVALPEMLKRGYDRRLAYGTVAGGGTLGILIPPSGSMIVFSSITEESTGALFIGGVIPGIMLAIIMAIYILVYCRKTGRYEKVDASSWRDRFVSLKTAIWAILAIVLVIGGIYTGLFTPTEAAAASVVYALVVGLARGKIKWQNFNKTLSESTHSSSMILMIIVGAMLLGTIITLLQIPQNIVQLVSELAIPVWQVMLILVSIYIVLGMFLEVVSILMITMPIVYPLIISLGIDGVWFGVWIILLMELALITPPVGLNLFVIQGISKANHQEVVMGTLPFMSVLVLGLVILAIWPQLIMWLPGTMGY